MNRNNCCSQNMTPYASRTMNAGGGRGYAPSREPMRPAHTDRYAERTDTDSRCGGPTADPGRCPEYQMPAPCGERMPSPCQRENDWRGEVPTGNRQKLFCYINEVSFAAYDALLYLDTHPNDAEALSYFHEYNRKRNYALKEYAKAYGPLNIGTMDDDASRSWEWACQPWPWEGGID